MKKTVVVIAFALMMIVKNQAQAQVLPQLLPNSAWCTGDGQPGANQVTLVATNKHNPATYCVTITVGNFGSPYEILDLGQFGWNNDFHINTVWNGPTSFGDYFISTGLSGPLIFVSNGRKTTGMNGLSVASLKAWHD